MSDSEWWRSGIWANVNNRTRLIENIKKNKNGTIRGKSRLMGSHPGSPALTATSSPSLKPTDSGSLASQTLERAKQQRFPIIHELVLEGRSFSDLREKHTEGSEQEFSNILNKVADFDENLQKYVLKRIYWDELDVHEYPYASEEDRQKAIDYLVKLYDRKRIEATNLLWQKLLPLTERGKGKCISKLNSRITAAQAAVSKSSSQKAEGSSGSGADSERDDSSESAKGKKTTALGGEPMNRSNSKKKPSPAEVQMKRMLSGGGSRKAVSAKASPKPSPTKSAAKAAGAPKGGYKSKEFVSDSSSDDDEVPLAQSKPTPVATPASLAKVTERLSEKPNQSPAATNKRETAVQKPKPKPRQAAANIPKEQEKALDKKVKEKDTIEAQVIARPSKPTPTTAKRARENDDDSSSSSGTPMIKRVKSRDSHQPQSTTSQAKHAAILAREKEREREREKDREARRLASMSAVNGGTGSSAVRQPRAVSDVSRSNGHSTRTRNVSPHKSSPLASSPPTNASELEPDRPIIRRNDRERARERERDRETVISSASSSNGDSSVSSTNGLSASSSVENMISRKRKTMSGNSSDERHDSKGSSVSSKRPRLSPEILNKAHKFKQFYTRYEALHREIMALEDPPKEKMDDLWDMRDRLSKMKNEIYREVSEDR
jgi:RNA polymerase II elongation factor ELL